MSATTAGALKAWLESQGLGVPWFRDRAPANQPLPYGTIDEGIAITEDAAFNSFDDPEGHVVEVATVHLWEQWRDPATGALTESPTLADAVFLALKGKRPTTAPTWVGGMTADRRRIPEEANNAVHNAFNVTIRRTLTRL